MSAFEAISTADGAQTVAHVLQPVAAITGVDVEAATVVLDIEVELSPSASQRTNLWLSTYSTLGRRSV